MMYLTGNKLLTTLPSYKDGRYKGKTNYKSMVGMDIEIFYEGDIYCIHILDYSNKNNKAMFKVEYNSNIYSISCISIKKGQIGSVIGRRTHEFKIEIGSVLKNNKQNMTILDRAYKNNKKGQRNKWYKYKCNKCGWDEGWMVEGGLLKGNSCACCTSKVIVEDINSIWATDRWMCDLGVSEQDAKTHTKCSPSIVEVICPNCKSHKKMGLNEIYNRKSIACVCGDGFSYPEKIMCNLLKQLNVEFEIQYCPNWSNKKRYDFYIPSENTIIETHGRQHYEESGKKRRRSLEEEQINDKYKHELALKNGVNRYIIIDCKSPILTYIKDNIFKSELNKLYDLSKIDWFECDLFASSSNMVKEVCDYWNNKEDWETVTTLTKVFPLGRSTILSYLNKGTVLGWCDYNGKEELKKSNAKKKKEKSMFKKDKQEDDDVFNW